MYGGGTSEGEVASNYFEKWGWYATIDDLAKGKIWKYDFVLNMNIHELHTALAHKIDKQKMKAMVQKKLLNKNSL